MIYTRIRIPCTMPCMHIRPFTPSDVPWALERIGAEMWTASRPSLEAILAADPDGCFIAEIDDAPAAMITSTTYGASAWVGHLIVLPELRRGGLGAGLMKHAIDQLHSRGVRTIRLEADPPGVSIYRSLGFTDEFESLRFHLTDPPCPSSTEEPILELDLEAASAFDAPRFGDDRSRLLGLLHERAACAYMVRKNDRINGYVMALPTETGLFVGPLVARNTRAAWDLLAATLVSEDLGTLTIGIPAPNTRAHSIVRDLGFEPGPSCLRMVLGEPVASGDPSSIFAIANGATG